jgi:threonylcarbamoyladenosine tRNA methylthiotransferase CDKAL1
MTNPPYILEHLDKIAKILNHPKVYAFLHIPVQSGSNAVLDKMNREYKVEDFNYVCGKFKFLQIFYEFYFFQCFLNFNKIYILIDYLIKNVPGITIATDVICGFPYETSENFEETLDLIKKYKFPVINISQFYSRPGTVAAKWKKVESKEVKRRSTATYKLFLSYPNYDHLKGTIQRVWIHDLKDEGRPVDENVMVAHTKSYAKVILPREADLIGKQVIVKVIDVHKWHVLGEIIDRHPKTIHVNFEDHFKGMYKINNADSNVNNRMAQIKKEQVDIHATINVENNFNENINTNVNAKDSKMNITMIISSILYLFAMYFLYLSLNRIFISNKL